MSTVPRCLVLRRATFADAWNLWRLAHRDSRPVPFGPLAVAEVDGDLVAAVSVTTGESIAEPFRPTAEIVELLRRYATVA